MMPKLSSVVSVIAIAAALVQGATISERDSPSCPADPTPPVCETSGRSPKTDDCAQALKQIRSRCYQGNVTGSYCQTLVKVGTCKIDVCGSAKSQLKPDINCGGYIQSLLNSCHDNNLGRVGGRIYPKTCNVDYIGDVPWEGDVTYLYHLQVSS